MASEQSRLDAAAASILAAYTAKQIASGGHEVWPPELAAQMRVDDMRAALLAAMPVLLGEPVGYQWLDSGNFRKGMPPYGDERDWCPVYAPSLGEGDGR